MRRAWPPTLVVLICTCSLVLGACAGSGDNQAPRHPKPPPTVKLTEQDKKVWAPLPPDRSAIPVLLYHGIGPESAFSNPDDAFYGVDPAAFAKQMTLLKHAGYQTVTLDEFVRFVTGDDVHLPPRPLLLTFDDARADSWIDGDGILRKLGLNAVLFVDVGRVSDGNPEYLTWDELKSAERSGRWRLQLHSGNGHEYIQYGSGPDDYGPFYAYEEPGESFGDWRARAFGDITWGQDELSARFPNDRPLAFAPPYGAYGQEGTNDSRIPGAMLDWLEQRYDVIFTQDRTAPARPREKEPLGRITVNRGVTGGQLHDMLVGSASPPGSR
jgi:peptidoglycan/xylan/chitin deacetylase (PgdA/CDA1 family)